jgi:site-specific DNA-methyltransferase (adenine-specific)
MKRKRLPINQIIHGDCLDVMKELPDKSIDMILCDLPYGTTACAWDTIIPFEPLWEQYERVIKDNGAIVLFGQEPFSSYLRMSNIKNYKYDWVWDKVKPNGHLVAKIRPMQRSETISVFGKKKINYYPEMIKLDKPIKGKEGKRTEIMGGVSRGYIKVYTEKYPQNIIVFSNGDRRVHPTQKPVPLCEYLIKTYTRPGEVVLDNCIGSGTTAIACINIGRNFIGIEKEEKYVRIAQKRIEACKKQNQMRLFPLSKLEKPPKRYKGLFE